MRRARAAALARGAFISARIFRTASGTGQHQDAATYIIAAGVPSHAGHREHDADPGPGVQPSGRRVPARGPAGLRRSDAARHLTGTANRRPRPVRPWGRREMPLAPATSSPPRLPLPIHKRDASCSPISAARSIASASSAAGHPADRLMPSVGDQTVKRLARKREHALVSMNELRFRARPGTDLVSACGAATTGRRTAARGARTRSRCQTRSTRWRPGTRSRRARSPPRP